MDLCAFLLASGADPFLASPFTGEYENLATWNQQTDVLGLPYLLLGITRSRPKRHTTLKPYAWRRSSHILKD